VTPERGPALWKRFLAGTVAIFLLTVTGSATAVLLEIDAIPEPPPLPIPELEPEDEIDAGDPQTLLLIGSDRRFGDRASGRRARSDTMILVRLDPDAPATTVLALPRDLRTGFAGGRVDKLNYAYEEAGPRGVVRAAKALMGPDFPIHHVVNVSFGAFTRGVNRLGCFYVDVDRRYFNDNDPPTRSATNYAAIDVPPGYQRLCGQDSLDFVRFRHLDTDFVRSARQQHYLAQAKDQVDFGRLLADRRELLRIFATYTDTDVRSLSARLRLLKLAAEAAGRPVRRVELAGTITEDLAYVVVAPQEVARARRVFLDPPAVRERRTPRRRGAGARRPSARTRTRALAPTLRPAPPAAGDAPAPFPVARPRYVVGASRLWDGHERSAPRTYALRGPDGTRHMAWRMVVDRGTDGQFYGLQSTTWPDPPILRAPSATQTRRGRRLMLFRDGSRLRIVAWREAGAVHWVANTLERTLTDREMLDLAATARVGR